MAEFQEIPTTIPISARFKGLKKRFGDRGIQFGQQYAPEVTRILTKPAVGEFRPWGTFFAYSVITIWVIMYILQFFDVLSNNKKLLIGVNFARLAITLIVFAFCSYSVLKGYRTVEISLLYQMIIGIISLLFSLGSTAFKIYKFTQIKDKKAMDYISMILAVILTIVLSIMVGAMIFRYARGDRFGQVGMLWMSVVTLFVAIMALINIFRFSWLELKAKET